MPMRVLGARETERPERKWFMRRLQCTFLSGNGGLNAVQVCYVGLNVR